MQCQLVLGQAVISVKFRGWNYRVLHRRRDVPNVGQVNTYEIIEAYYGPDDEIVAYAEAVPPGGDSVDELRNDLTYMLRALELETLDEDELPTEERNAT